MKSFTRPEIFTQGKTAEHNEDKTGWNEFTLVLCDGVSDKSGRLYSGRTGGEVAAEVVVKSVLKSLVSGPELVREVNEKLKRHYQELNPGALMDNSRSFGSTLVVARLVGNEIVVTQVGDSPFRINGMEMHTIPMLFDEYRANRRKEYIERTGDIAGSRAAIADKSRGQQGLYTNNPDHEWGYGVIDGTEVPDKFVRVYRYPVDQVQTIELVSDGYPALPEVATVEAYEQLYGEIERTDPHRYKLYPATKPKDDRTVLIETLP